jgi:spore coat protein CotH
MISTIVKRIIIFAGLAITLITLELTSEESLLMQLPSNEDITEILLDKQEQEQEVSNPVAEADQISKREIQIADYQELFSNQVRHTFIIEFEQTEWDGLINDMEAYNEQYGSYRSNNYRNVTVTYVDDDTTKVINDVGFRSKGNVYSRRLPIDNQGNPREIHFMLKFNETFDIPEGIPAYDALKTREVFDIEQLLFKWNNQYDPSYSNEVYSYEMFDRIGVPIPEASYAEVRIVIDGETELVSFYNIFEHYDEEFVRKTLQDEPTKVVGDLFKGSWSGDFDPIYNASLYGVRDWESNSRPIYSKETNKDDPDFSNLVLFTLGLSKRDLDDRKTFIEENFNVDSFIRAMAMNVLLGNPDDYRGNTNNYYFYFDESDYMTYIPFDYDNSLGSGWNGDPAFIDYTLGNDIYDWGQFEWTPEPTLWDNIIYYEEYQILYEDYLMQFINDGTYSVNSYNALFITTKSLYDDEFVFYNNKAEFINEKIEVVTEQVEYYRSLRN